MSFDVVDVADGSPLTGASVTVYLLADGGTQTTTTNAAVEEGNGIYSVDLTAAEWDADLIVLKPSATGGYAAPVQVSTTPIEPYKLFVDATAGNDSNDGLTPEAAKATLTAAKTAASAGDTIYVAAGAYDEKNLAKNGVDWHFAEGANVVSTAATAGGIWDDTSTGANGAASFAVAGRGTFTISSAVPNADAVRISSGSRLVIECDKIDSAKRCIAGFGGELHVRANELSSVDGVLDNLGPCTLFVDCPYLHGEGYIYECDDADAKTFVRTLYAVTTGGDVAGGSAGYLFVHGGLHEATQAGSNVFATDGAVAMFVDCAAKSPADGTDWVSTAQCQISPSTIVDPAKVTGSVYGTLDLLAARARAEIDASSTKLAAIALDTGTTLPAALDAVPTANENAAALMGRNITADTTAGTMGGYMQVINAGAGSIGVNGSGLTALPINDLSLAEIIGGDISGASGADTIGKALKDLAAVTPDNTIADEDAVSGGSTMPRVNRRATYRLVLSDRFDDDYECTRKVKLRPGDVGAKAVSIDMRPLFGDALVQTVGTPVVSGSGVTCTGLGPYDTEAMVEIDGTTVGGDAERTVDVPVTMETGEEETVRFRIRTLAE